MTNTNQKTLDIANFGNNLKQFRIARGFTREQFAELIDVSARIIYDYEDGFKYPSLGTLIKIAIALNVSLDSILRWSRVLSFYFLYKKVWLWTAGSF